MDTQNHQYIVKIEVTGPDGKNHSFIAVIYSPNLLNESELYDLACEEYYRKSSL